MEKLIIRELLFGTFVGMTEGLIVYFIMVAFGMFDTIAIYG